MTGKERKWPKYLWAGKPAETKSYASLALLGLSRVCGKPRDQTVSLEDGLNFDLPLQTRDGTEYEVRFSAD